jgi:Rieske Fe-S protein
MAEQSKPTTADRRTVLRATAIGVAAAGVGVTAAACSSNNSIAQGSSATTASAAPTATATGPVNLATTSQVPVGGGMVNQDAQIVITQPTAGEYKAFTAICTHAHCTVGSVTNNVILCPCHGSEYSAKDGSVLRGPAPQALAPETIKVTGSNIVLEA